MRYLVLIVCNAPIYHPHSNIANKICDVESPPFLQLVMGCGGYIGHDNSASFLCGCGMVLVSFIGVLLYSAIICGKEFMSILLILTFEAILKVLRGVWC